MITTSKTKITCRVDDSDFVQDKIKKRLAAGKIPELMVFLKASEEAKCSGTTCNWTFKEEKTLPVVKSITNEFDSSNSEHLIKVKGTGFTGSKAESELIVGGIAQETKSFSSTEVVFKITDLKSGNDIKKDLKFYLNLGKPSGQAIIDAGAD